MDQSTIVIYRSKTGFTKQYAQWLAEELGCAAVPYGDRKGLDLTAYQTILFGDNLHAGMLPGLRWLKEQLPKLAGRRTAVFVVGACPPDAPALAEAMTANFSDPIWEGVERVYLQGGLRYDKMGLMDRILMAGLRTMLRKKEGEDSPAYQGVARSFDASSREAIAPLTAWARA